MTLIVGAIDRDSAAVHLAGDTKVWWEEDETKSRRIYIEPALKILLLSDDVAVGYAGDGPETIARRAIGLRNNAIDQLLDGLTEIDGASFIVARRNSGQLWRVEHGDWGEVTSEGLAIIGDDEQLDEETSVFQLVERRYKDFPGCPAGFRLQSTMQHIVHLVRPTTIGGFTVVASATNESGFRYASTPSALFEAIRVPGPVEWPLTLSSLPGTLDTPGALAFWIEEARIGHLFCDGQPAVPHTIKSGSAAGLAEIAHDQWQQSLIVPDDPLMGLMRQK